MGDTGSLTLGYILSSICVLSQKLDGDLSIAPISMALILALPIADTFWVMGNRVLKGGSPFLADNTHLHHKLMTLNLSHSGVVAVLYVCVFVCGFLAVFMQSMLEWVQFATGIGFIIFLYVSVALLQRSGFKFPDHDLTHTAREHNIDQLDRVNSAEYLIGGRLTKMRGNFCREHSWWDSRPLNSYSGEMSVTVEWSVLNTLTKNIMIQEQSEGYFRLNRPTRSGISIVFENAFADAAKAFAANSDLRKLATGQTLANLSEEKFPGGAYAIIGGATPAAFDIAALRPLIVTVRVGQGHGSGFLSGATDIC